MTSCCAPGCCAGVDRPQTLTLIVAPAGYGKTTLAGSWVAHCSRPTAWVSLDAEDNTLAVFVQELVMAARRVFPTFGDEILSLVASTVELTPDMVLPGLLNSLDQLDRDFVLVLDDYHHIVDSSIHQLLWGLLAHPPRPLHLVLTASTIAHSHHACVSTAQSQNCARAI